MSRASDQSTATASAYTISVTFRTGGVFVLVSDAQITFRALDPSHDTDGRIASVGHALSVEAVAIVISIVIVFAEIVTVAVVVTDVLRRDVSASMIGETKFGGAEVSVFFALGIFTTSLARVRTRAIIRL